MPKCNSCGEIRGLLEMREGVCKACRIKQSDILENPPNSSILSESSFAKHIVITLSSGSSINISEIMLYDVNLIRTLAQLQAKANEKLEGFSTGLGFIGGLGAVVISSMILGALEGAVSNSMTKDGFQLLEQIERVREKIKISGRFFHVSDIYNTMHPTPECWHTSNKKTDSNIVADIFVSIFEPFLTVKTSEGFPVFLRWKDVEQYRPTLM
jgi:hypothetical protein